MTTIAAAASSVDISVDAASVWALVGGFGSLPDWLPYITSSELGDGGRTRQLTNADGGVIIERLVAFDDTVRSYRYAIVSAPFPVTDYLSTLRVIGHPNGTASRIVWSGHFTPAGVSVGEAAQLFQRIYDDGLVALTSHYQQDVTA